MDHRDALAPLIELIGVFAGSAVSPLTAALVCMLAMWLTHYPRYLAVAAVIGISDAAFGEVIGATTVGLAAAAAAGAAATLLQAWCVWPMMRAAKNIGNSVFRRDRRG